MMRNATIATAKTMPMIQARGPAEVAQRTLCLPFWFSGVPTFARWLWSPFLRGRLVLDPIPPT